VNIIPKIRKIVKKESVRYISPTIYRYHILPVVKFSKILAKKLKVKDPKVVEIAAWLHDIGSFEGDESSHHVSGQRHAETILTRLKYPKEKIEIVKRCIYSHRASQKINRLTLEEQCLACADALAHIDQPVSLLYHAFKGKKMNLPQGRKWVREKLKRSWDKLIPEAKELIKEKYFFLQKIL
jgi:HD superfamily phosphodiesterase